MPSNLLENLALGTVQFGLDYGISNLQGQTPLDEVSGILNFAWNNGLTYLDTAYSYGNSEAVLGNCMEHDFNVVTKFPFDKDLNKIEIDFLDSLRQLKREKVYALLTHEADYVIKQPEIWDLLQKLKSAGLVDKIGFSLYFPKDIESLLSLGFFPDLVQVPLNLIDKRFKPYFNELKSGGCEIHSRSAFLQGLFFLKPDQLNDFFNEVKPLIGNLHKTFPDNEELSSFLIRTCLNCGVDKVVIGVNNLPQLQNIVSGLSWPERQTDLNFDCTVTNEKIILPFNWPSK